MQLNHHVSIDRTGVYIDGHLRMDFDETVRSNEFELQLKEWYKRLPSKYAKFHKMDTFSKLGFLACEHLMMEVKHTYRGDRIGIFLVNSFSSIRTDEKFHQSYSASIDAIASPGLFVYTLPNILIGELSIRHKITGEHMFFVQQNFASDFIYLYVKTLFNNDLLDAAILGTCELTKSHCLAQMAWVVDDETQGDGKPLDKKNFIKWIEPLSADIT